MMVSRGRGGLSSHILSTKFSAIATIAMLAPDNACVTITHHPLMVTHSPYYICHIILIITHCYELRTHLQTHPPADINNESIPT